MPNPMGIYAGTKWYDNFQLYLSKSVFQNYNYYCLYLRKLMNVIDPHVASLLGMTDSKDSFKNKKTKE